MNQLYTRTTSGEQMESNLIPMINIIFLLLIFFMVAGHISRQAKPKALTLATAQSSLQVKPSKLKLSLTKDGQYYKGDDRTSLAEITAYFAKKPTISEVNVQADKQVTSGDLDVLLDVLRAANVGRIVMTVEQAKS